MSSKIEVSRELAEKVDDVLYIMTGEDSYQRLVKKYGTGWWGALTEMRAELRSVIAAPVVERQLAPIGNLYRTAEDQLEIELVGNPAITDGMPIYESPPELAELQSTIARLTAENERLKGGQGEPVAWRHTMHYGEGCGYRFELTDSEESPFVKPDIDYDKSFIVTCEPLYASQPAPLSVVTREQVEIVAESIYWQWAGRGGFVPWVKGGNSLKQDEARSIAWSTLDKVKELNQ